MLCMPWQCCEVVSVPLGVTRLGMGSGGLCEPCLAQSSYGQPG